MHQHSPTSTDGSRVCLRHEIAMLRMTAASPRGADGAGSRRHASLLEEIHQCPRCRRRRGEGGPTRLVVTLTCPDDADLGEVASVVQEILPDRLPDSVETITVKVA